ncbi:hypothetical protein KEM56_005130, partial [Ascosphaera pollenicola]
TRSHKYNERIHSNGSSAQEPEQLPRYFAKTGHIDADPKKTKKNGGGKSNWGHPGEEKDDYGYTFAKSRRYSNSSTHDIKEFKSKFEAIEPEPVFEESVHGPLPESSETLSKLDTSSLSSSSTPTSEGEPRHEVVL